MTRFFILDDSEKPALYGRAASHYANKNNLPLWSVRPSFPSQLPDSHQHVCAAGYCVTSGLYVSDTLEQEVCTTNELLNSPLDCVIVLSTSDTHLISDLNGPRFIAECTNDSIRLVNDTNVCLCELFRDDYSRYLERSSYNQGRKLCIGLIGNQSDHQNGYSAVITSLGDAAESLSIDLSIKYLPPSTLTEDLLELDAIDGVILPGGSSMSAVAGQIKVAKLTLEKLIPTLGLCLGMQSMATAIVQQHEGYEAAMLEEVADNAPIFSFSAFPDQKHRCGVFTITPKIPLSRLMASGPLHYNHRYRFSPGLIPLLQASGVIISAQTDDIVEAISHSNHPFWHGVQGHPELSSRQNAPHPLFVSFLKTLIN